jgi:hypothetical protein
LLPFHVVEPPDHPGKSPCGRHLPPDRRHITPDPDKSGTLDASSRYRADGSRGLGTK